MRLFRLRNVATANGVGVLWAGAMFAWFFLSALYLKLVLDYSPLEVGLAFLPANIIMGILSIGLSAKLVMRYGIRKPLGVGLLFAAAGLVLFVRAPVHGSFVVDVLPSMILLGLGAGMAFNPVLLAAMSDVAPEESGLASGLVNTSFMMGGALGLAILASLAAWRTDSLRADGEGPLAALAGGLPRRVPRRRDLRRSPPPIVGSSLLLRSRGSCAGGRVRLLERRARAPRASSRPRISAEPRADTTRPRQPVRRTWTRDGRRDQRRRAVGSRRRGSSSRPASSAGALRPKTRCGSPSYEHEGAVGKLLEPCVVDVAAPAPA